jgi:hypothetical protein
MLFALAWGLTLVSVNLEAQSPGSMPVDAADQSDQSVPVGPPVTIDAVPFAAPLAAPFITPQSPTTGGMPLGQSYDGIDFLGSNCFCLPPDTNAAVGNNFVVETVNIQIRIFDKDSGSKLLDQPLSTLFGASTRGDPYAVYDDNSDRWYITAFDSSANGLFLAVSSDGNPLHGFQTHHLTNVGDFPDYAKLGFNKDAIFISYNDFGLGGGAAATIASIDKAAVLSGTLTYFVSRPKFQFRAMPPAQMHHDLKGGVEWFVSTDGTDGGGNAIRVTKMTNYLSNNPQFEYTSLPVTPYRNASTALQPGGTVTTFPNTTTTQVQYHKGHLVTAMASSIASDGFTFPKGLYYQIDVKGNDDSVQMRSNDGNKQDDEDKEDNENSKPRLVREGIINPGPGVAVQMPSVDEDKNGNLGFTWMESSNSEYLSMWVGSLSRNGQFSSQSAAPGGGFFYVSFRIGDYSTTVLDPSDGKTFWSANEYIGSDGASDIWRTHITSFTASPHCECEEEEDRE